MNTATRNLPTQTPETAKALTVYFDGGCPVCSKEIAYYQRQVGAQACEWIDASTCPDTAFGSDLTRDAALARFHVRHPSGELTSGMGGFAALWRVLPKTAWLGRVASLGPVPFLMDQAYRVFLALRPLWRPSGAGTAAGSAATLVEVTLAAETTSAAVSTIETSSQPWPVHIVRELRSDHAGEVGAVQIYRGMLAVSRNPGLRAFAQHHLATEQAHLLTIESHLPAAQRSRLLGAWRVAGWITGALPAVFGPNAAYATVAAVETFVDQHYAHQIDWIDAHINASRLTEGGQSIQATETTRLANLRVDLERCRLDELQHRDEARLAGVAQGWLVNLWTTLVSSGSASAVVLARRV